MNRVLIFLSLLGGTIVFAQTNAATTQDWQRDTQEIVNDVLAIHPAPFAKVGELTWRRQAEALQNDMPLLSDEERLVRLMQLVAMIGDGHTQIELLDKGYSHWYPIRIYEFSDGYFVTSAHESVADLAGAEIIEIAGLPAEEVIGDARGLMGADNQFDRSERLYAVHNAVLMQGLGYANKDRQMEITFRLPDDSVVTRILDSQPANPEAVIDGYPIFEWHYRSEEIGTPIGTHDDWISAFNGLRASEFDVFDESRPLHLQHRSIYSRRALPEFDAYYVQFNQTDDSGMNGFMLEALEEIDELKPRRLIIDIRLNFGGDGSTVAPMIRQLIRREANPPWDEIYLITGRKTFSAAMGIVDGMIDQTNVTLVGEPPGAPLNFNGDNQWRPYPALGLRLDVSALTHQNRLSDDIAPFVPVDVPALMSFEDYATGKDPSVDPILAGSEMRSIPAIILAEGGQAAREAFQAREERFGNLDWFTKPDEFHIRGAVDALEDQERFDEALEAAWLNTELHPYIWNTWYNLADAQRQAGLMDERLGSYKCVVLLAPTNWNVPPIMNLFERLNVDPDPTPGCPVGE